MKATVMYEFLVERANDSSVIGLGWTISEKGGSYPGLDRKMVESVTSQTLAALQRDRHFLGSSDSATSDMASYV